MMVVAVASETSSRVIVAWALGWVRSEVCWVSPFPSYLRIDRELRRDDHISGCTLEVNMGLQVDS